MSSARPLIRRTDVRLWSPGVVSADPSPELSTTDEWRLLMAAGRRDRKWTQEELGEKIARHSKLPASQALISQIESGKITSSKLVRPICEVLSIPEPMHFTDERMKRWWLAGHLMRGAKMEVFESQLESMEAILKALGVTLQTANDGTATTKPTRK
jgi:transcriptional regulator with XRE-family HTH domain